MSSDILQYMSDFDIYYDKDQLAHLNDSLFSKIQFFKDFNYKDLSKNNNNQVGEDK